MKMETEITDGNITIRKLTVADSKNLYDAIVESINELSPWFNWCGKDYSVEQHESWCCGLEDRWIKEQDLAFGIFKYSDGRLLGYCNFIEIDDINLRGSIGAWVRTSETNKGICTAATRLMAKFGFEELKLVRIEILVDFENNASRRVVEKIGAVKEGVLRNRIKVRNKISDAYCYSLIPEDVAD